MSIQLYTKTKHIYQNIFSILILAISVILICLSLLSIFSTLFKLTSMSYCWETNCIDYLLNTITEHQTLYAGTIATIVAFLGLLRLEAATEANKDKLRNDHFSEWKTCLEIISIKIEKEDSYMKNHFILIRQKLFPQLYNMNFKIKNLEELKLFFNANFKNVISDFESQNQIYIKRGGCYPSNDFAFAYDSFLALINWSINEKYESFIKDLRVLYMSSLDPKREIDNKKFPGENFIYKEMI